MELREYQSKIISDLRDSIRAGHKRIIVQLYVGGGKTVIASEIMRTAKEKFKRSLFIAPRRQLVYQAVATLDKFGLSSGTIMAGEQPFGQPLIQVCSMDTIIGRVNSGRMHLPAASIAIVDECHHGFTVNRLELLRNYPLVIGLTSTPVLANGKGMGGFYEDIVEGPTMRHMVDYAYLVPMRYFAADAPDLTRCKKDKDGDYQEKDLAIASDTPELIGSIYENYMRIASQRTTLIFAVNVAHARHIHDTFAGKGIQVGYIDGNTPTNEREEIKRNVESGKIKVIVNIGVMSFGTDWPIISCIIIARVTRNIASWIQMVGRGSRLHPGKKDCLIIYHGDNFDELGPIDDPIEWSLDDKSTVRERKEIAAKLKEEPKDITCVSCGRVFRGMRKCPACGHEMVAKGEEIPFHEADLKEIVKKIDIDKKQWYAELLGYAKLHNKHPKYATALFHKKFGEWPENKLEAVPVYPNAAVIGYCMSSNIAYAKSNKKTGRKAKARA